MSYVQVPARTNSSPQTLAVDVSQLQANIEALKGGVAATPPALTMEQLQWRTYQTDVAAAGGNTPTVTIDVGLVSKSYGYLTPYQTSDGQWWVRGCVGYEHTSATIVNLKIAGMVCAGGGSLIPCSGYYIVDGQCYVNNIGSTGVFEIYQAHPLVYTEIYASFDVPILAKPDWAY